jgi:hypothetical protein
MSQGVLSRQSSPIRPIIKTITIHMENILIIGMSPGNGYFKQEVIDKLLVFALNKYQNIAVFIPDVPAISTYIALGYPENIARNKKAISQGNNFRNRIKKSILDQNLDKNNIQFKLDINSATETVLLHNPIKKKDILLEDIEIGTHYIISEFAFMLFLPQYVDLAQYKYFTYGYHNLWPVWEKFISGEYDGSIKENLRFELLPNFS